MKYTFLLIVLFSLLALSSRAQREVKINHDLSNPLPIDMNVKIGKLPNGLTYYIRKNTEPAKRAVLYLVTNVGSLMEDDDQLGLAHFAEHMAFNGTRDFPKNELIDYLQKAGVKFGADVNASTSFNETIYKLPLPTDSVDIFKKSFSILANWAGLVTFDENAINTERGIILEEERSRGKNVTDRNQKQVFPTLLNHSRYAIRMPIGTEEVLMNFKPSVIKRFYRDWYRPNLQAVVAVGDFDPLEVEQLIVQNFTALANPVNQRERKVYSIPESAGTSVNIVTDPEQSSTRLQIIVRHKGKTVKTGADLLESISRKLFNRMMEARVSEFRRKPNTPIHHGAIRYGNFLADTDAFSIVMTAKSGEIEAAVKDFLILNEQIKQFGFTETELARAKKVLLNTNHKEWIESSKSNSINYVNQYVNHFLKGSAIPGIEYEYYFLKRHLESIKLQEVNRLAESFNSSDNRVVILEAPENDRHLIPNDSILLSWIDYPAPTVYAYEDDINTDPILLDKPTGGKVIKQNVNLSLGVMEITLGNGVRVILKPTSFKNDEIIIQGYSYGGTSLAPDSIYTSASLATLLVNRSGLGNLSKSQLNKKLSGKSVKISASISDFTESISGSASPGELETALQLIYLYFTQPRKDEDAWSSTISQQQSSLLNRGANPTQVFQDTINAVLNNYSIRKAVNTVKELDKASIDHAYDFYKDRFSDASDFTFFLVGNLDTAKIKPLLAQYLGALPYTKRIENYKDHGIGIPSGRIRKVVSKGLEEKSRVQLVYSGKYKYSDKNNLQLEALTEVVKYRLLSRLRGQESGVYTPSVSLNYSNIPSGNYSITISFNCAPAMVSTLIKASMEEVAEIRKKGPNGIEIQKYNIGEQRTKETQVNNNNYWAYYLRKQYIVNEIPDKIFLMNKYLNTITKKSIKKTANQYMNGKNLIEFILMPEK